jgi:hypothetical protein
LLTLSKKLASTFFSGDRRASLLRLSGTFAGDRDPEFKISVVMDSARIEKNMYVPAVSTWRQDPGEVRLAAVSRTHPAWPE